MEHRSEVGNLTTAGREVELKKTEMEIERNCKLEESYRM